MRRNDTDLATGTGMVWRHFGKLWIVTAWHCITGAHHQTGQSLSRNGARPNWIDAGFITRAANKTAWYSFRLHDDYDNPNWIIHPLGSQKIDLAAFPVEISLPPQAFSTALNDVRATPMQVRVGSELFILGFPLGIGRLTLPIWKRASMATEPAAILNEDSARFYIVDTASREGMSGAAVIARKENLYTNDNGTATLEPGHHTKIIGVYTGRLSTKDPLGAQLGIVWPRDLIDELIAACVKDTFV